MDFIFENNTIKLNNELFKSGLFNANDIKKLVSPLNLSKNWKNKISFNTFLTTSNVNPFDEIGVKSDEISNKISSIINHEVSSLNLKIKNNLEFNGQINLGNDQFIDFGKEFKTKEELIQYCSFIDDLYFLKDRIGYTLKCNLTKNGNLKFYNESKRQITKENINKYYNSITKDYTNKLHNLKHDIFNIEKNINKIEFELSSKQLNNDILISKIEKFSFCSNNFINAFKYYLIEKDNSLYSRSKTLFSNEDKNEKNMIFDTPMLLNNQETTNEKIHMLTVSTNKLRCITTDNSHKLRENLISLVNQVNSEQTNKKTLIKRYDNLKNAYKKVINNEKTFKYIIQKINKNSNSILGIIKYRKQIIKDLKIYGFKVAAA